MFVTSEVIVDELEAGEFINWFGGGLGVTNWGGGGVGWAGPRFNDKAAGFKFLSLTFFSKCVMTSTAMFRTANLVWGLSAAFGLSVITTRPNSVKASLMSLIRIRSLELFDTLLSLSLCSLMCGAKLSSACACLPRLLFTPPVALRPPFPTEFREVVPLLGGGGTVEDGCSIAKGSEKFKR